MKRLIVIVLASVIMSGCATPYQRSGFRGGYKDSKVSENIYKTEFSGNQYTGIERASDYALLRAAELTLENGYSYFTLPQNQDYSDAAFHTAPAQPQDAGMDTVQHAGDKTSVQEKPRTNLTVQCFKTKPENASGTVYAAREVSGSLREKYGLQISEPKN